MNFELVIKRIQEMCALKGVTPNKAFTESGAGKDFIANLRKGRVPSTEKFNLLSSYLGTTTDHLSGNDQEEKSPAEAEDEDFRFALLDGTRELSEEAKQDLIKYKEYLRQKYFKK